MLRAMIFRLNSVKQALSVRCLASDGFQI